MDYTLVFMVLFVFAPLLFAGLFIATVVRGSRMLKDYTCDISTGKPGRLISFTVPGSIEAVRNKILNLSPTTFAIPGFYLKNDPGHFILRGDQSIAFEPSSFYFLRGAFMIYLSDHENTQTLVEIGYLSSSGRFSIFFSPATLTVMGFANSIQSALGGSGFDMWHANI